MLLWYVGKGGGEILAMAHPGIQLPSQLRCAVKSAVSNLPSPVQSYI